MNSGASTWSHVCINDDSLLEDDVAYSVATLFLYSWSVLGGSPPRPYLSLGRRVVDDEAGQTAPHPLLKLMMSP